MPDKAEHRQGCIAFQEIQSVYPCLVIEDIINRVKDDGINRDRFLVLADPDTHIGEPKTEWNSPVRHRPFVGNDKLTCQHRLILACEDSRRSNPQCPPGCIPCAGYARFVEQEINILAGLYLSRANKNIKTAIRKRTVLKRRKRKLSGNRRFHVNRTVFSKSHEFLRNQIREREFSRQPAIGSPLKPPVHRPFGTPVIPTADFQCNGRRPLAGRLRNKPGINAVEARAFTGRYDRCLGYVQFSKPPIRIEDQECNGDNVGNIHGLAAIVGLAGKGNDWFRDDQALGRKVSGGNRQKFESHGCTGR
ncbi:MAG: hypothetical protein H6881_09060 [Rhodobiaceae bacterium]|nr:hypothetical protein [Rhodobiaceae bacterium]MCC0061645.1 hypothetical protein [Rhodobiaceae bacterium]